jgi:hypothetical protein
MNATLSTRRSFLEVYVHFGNWLVDLDQAWTDTVEFTGTKFP